MPLLVGCTKSDPPAPVPTPAPVVTVVPAEKPAAPAAAASPIADGGTAAAGDEEFDWDLAEEPEGTDFEIDAAATSYFMPRGNTVQFKAKALNGSPPVTFTWDYGDKSPTQTGETAEHRYDELGRFDAIVTGKDANGETSTVLLGLMVVTAEEFIERLKLDPAVLPRLQPPPSPAATP